MAWIRQSPGVYKNDQTGEVRKGQSTKPTDDAAAAAPAAVTAPPVTNAKLEAAKANLQQQVANGLPQAAADAEYNRLVSTGYGVEAPSAMQSNLTSLFAGDPALQNAVAPALNLAGLGSDPSTGFFADGSLGRVDEKQTATQNAILDAAKANQAASTVVNPYTTQALQGLSTLSSNAGKVDPNLQLALDTRKAGLEGYTPAEMQAFREQQLPQMDAELNAALRAAKIGGLNANLSGGMSLAALPSILAGSQNATRGLERDIFLSNIDEKAKRLSGFENLASNVDQNRYARTLESNNALGAMGQNQQQINVAGRSQSLQDWSNVNQSIRDDLLGRNVFNLNQIGKEKAGQTGMLFGTLGLAGEREGSKQAFDLAKEQLEIARTQANNPARSTTNYNMGSTKAEVYDPNAGLEAVE